MYLIALLIERKNTMAADEDDEEDFTPVAPPEPHWKQASQPDPPDPDRIVTAWLYRAVAGVDQYGKPEDANYRLLGLVTMPLSQIETTLRSPDGIFIGNNFLVMSRLVAHITFEETLR